MRERPTIKRLALPFGPLDLLAGWPMDVPLMVIRSGAPGVGGPPSGWARWSIFARPHAWFICGDGGTVASGSRLAGPSPLPEVSLTGEPLADLDAILESTRLPSAAAQLPIPFVGGWIGYLSYDLGRVIEPAAVCRISRPDEPRPWPLMQFAWCPTSLVHDGRSGTWYSVGDDDGTWASMADRALAAGPIPPCFRVGQWTSSTEPEDYLDSVSRILDYIRAGDIFQANLTQRLSAPFSGSTRHLARQALATSEAWYGSSLELPDGRAIISMSPELFLRVDGRFRDVVCRPIKGTRPRRVDPRELLESEKDAAELHMIVDLMRNDLGRVCEFGSVRVPRPRIIETHGTVHHGVGEIRGDLRDDVSAADLIAATFPCGSVTGAPKIRAMQIIDELEPFHRGPYCGAVGYFSDSGYACLNVAIRTMLLTGERTAPHLAAVEGMIDYAVGGGIVADSEPEAEYRESLDKAAVLQLAVAKDPPRPRR